MAVGDLGGRQLHVLQQYQPSRAKKFKLSDVKEMFEQMKDHA